MKGDKNETTEDIDLQELDLGDFKTVDSIGDVDGLEGKHNDFKDKIFLMIIIYCSGQ